jgi:hypothetical protein
MGTIVKHEHYTVCCICFEIHLSVQAPFQGAGVVESTVMSQHHSIQYIHNFVLHNIYIDTVTDYYDYDYDYNAAAAAADE